MLFLWKNSMSACITEKEFFGLIPSTYISNPSDKVYQMAEVAHHDGKEVQNIAVVQTEEGIKEALFPLFKEAGSVLASLECKDDADTAMKMTGIFPFNEVFIACIGTFLTGLQGTLNKMPKKFTQNTGLIRLLEGKLIGNDTIAILKPSDGIEVLGKAVVNTKYGVSYTEVKRYTTNTSYSGTSSDDSYVFCAIHRKQLTKGEKFFRLHPDVMHDRHKQPKNKEVLYKPNLIGGVNVNICENCFNILRSIKTKAFGEGVVK